MAMPAGVQGAALVTALTPPRQASATAHSQHFASWSSGGAAARGTIVALSRSRLARQGPPHASKKCRPRKDIGRAQAYSEPRKSEDNLAVWRQ